jgi:16S rRNA (guanine527-N7)-methyltransferase
MSAASPTLENAPGPSFGPADFQALAGASDAQMIVLHQYRAMLEDWNSRMNLVGPSALDGFWLRHAWDSAQLLSVAGDKLRWADLGAGAGFPGLVLAILLKGRPGAEVHLVESLAKRCRFLDAAANGLGLPAIVHNGRAEHTPIAEIQVVTARACAPMIKLLEFAHPLLKSGAVGLFLKGKDAPTEILDARRLWRFDAELLESRSGGRGHIVKVERLFRV